MLLQFFSAVDIAHYAMFGTNWLIATAAVPTQMSFSFYWEKNPPNRPCLVLRKVMALFLAPVF